MTKLPKVDAPPLVGKTLPYDQSAVESKGFSFSFVNFDREHELFNLGDPTTNDKVVSGKWFLDLLDCLKDVSGYKDRREWWTKRKLHEVRWESANAKHPQGYEQLTYWQFRINKSRGRVIGYFIDETFYIVWLDPHHNLTNSKGYGKEEYFERPKSEYETMIEEMSRLTKENESLKADIEELLS